MTQNKKCYQIDNEKWTINEIINCLNQVIEIVENSPCCHKQEENKLSKKICQQCGKESKYYICDECDDKNWAEVTQQEPVGDWEKDIKKYILMGFNAEGIEKENAEMQTRVVFTCIEPIIRQLLQQALKEYKSKVIDIISKRIVDSTTKEEVDFGEDIFRKLNH